MPRFPLILIVLVIGAVTGAGCYRGGGDGAGRGPRDILTAEEIRAEPSITTAYEAVQRLRPGFLRGRTTASLRPDAAGRSRVVVDELVVYLNGTRYGGIETLRRIGAGEVVSIRYLSATEATTLYGTGHAGGVLDVRTGA